MSSTVEEVAGATEATPVARLRGVHIGFGAPGRERPVVRGVELDLVPGRVTALVGESGSGKSLTTLALMGLLPGGARVSAGSVEIDGQDTAGFTDAQWRRLRGPKIAMVFQDPMAALNPSFTVGWQVAETFRRHQGVSHRTARARTIELMRTVGIPDAEHKYHSYPHEFSGGMRQRAMIAMALALEPEVLLADEPTTALDVTVQAQILRLLTTRQAEARMAMLLVSHDLGVVARVAQHVAVMYAGRIVEAGTLDEVYTTPAHPYTRGLLDAMPDPGRPGRLVPIEGQPPAPGHLPAGCAFAPRCRFATEVCRTDDPATLPVPGRGTSTGHVAACHHSARILGTEPEARS
ncbi:ABC transporter ATP-binding protein [Actinoallomurus iriomotensis]|jgi:oligopeptide/dipeptide ABC transporter ATP-binding protein|uniref:ABC transporter ATP-binding protein n=1 Tax=Actinoallomurus iriomotensis TaxID=478107 RepID=A0A9W6RHG1_9ACTN|nr:ABC transporter ATP-binding protein [Actinoallomurus iriomotensis]GLY75629.1 ABC transporter ATP-binding protein [Actinoallomurus iriomotensis]